MKRFIMAVIISTLIITAIVYFTFEYKPRPSNVRSIVWSNGQDIANKYLKTIKNMERVKLQNMDGVNVFNDPVNKKNLFITSEEQYNNWIFESFLKIRRDESVEFTEEEKLIINELISVYDQLLQCDNSIRDYDIEIYKAKINGEKIPSRDILIEKKNKVVDGIKLLKIKTEKLQNIYGLNYEEEINKVLDVINETL
jgi:hypothetical protein